MQVLNDKFLVAARVVLSIVLTLASGYSSRSQEASSAIRSDALLADEFQEPKPEYTNSDLPDAPRTLPLQARRMTMHERFRIYRHSVFNPDSLFAPAFGAAVAQANNEPPEWGQGASGYATRLASGYGRLVINRTIRFGVAALDHEDPRFSYSNEEGFWRRFRYASIHYVVARTDSGKRIPAFSRFAGTYGAAFIANEWYPESRANTGHALMRGSTALAAGWGWNVFREFWPDIKRTLRRSKDQQD
jgi:hypothetical protein